MENSRSLPSHIPYVWAVALAFILVYPVFTGNTEIFDQVAHRDFARTLLQEGRLVTPHFGYHLMLLGVNATIPGGALRIASITVNIAAYVVAATFFFGYAHRQLTNVSLRWRLGVALAVLPLTILAGPPLAALSYHTDFRLNGYIIFNQFHSPTQSALLPLALPLFYLSAQLLLNNGHLTRLQKICLVVLAVLAPLTKPNFSMVLVPALLWVAGYRTLIRREGMAWRPLLGWVVIPSIIALSWQFIFTYIQQAEIGYGINDNNGILFAPFRTALYFDTDLLTVAVKLITSLALPIWAWISYRAVRDDAWIRFTWWMVLIGVVQYVLLSESGDFYMAANFNWGLRTAALFLYGLVLIRVINSEWSDGWATASLARRLISLLLILAHLAAGMTLYGGYAQAIVPTLP